MIDTASARVVRWDNTNAEHAPEELVHGELTCQVSITCAAAPLGAHLTAYDDEYGREWDTMEWHPVVSLDAYPGTPGTTPLLMCEDCHDWLCRALQPGAPA